MSFYSNEYIKILKEEFRLFDTDKSQYAEIVELIAKIAPNDKQTQLYNFAYYGILRRIEILNKCVENIFNIRNFYLETIPDNNELLDITINLQCFVVNLYGVLENLAWVYAICINFKDSKYETSFFGKKNKLLDTLPENIRNSFVGDEKWLKYIKNIRDLLAHQEPFYIPPYCVIMEKRDKWQVLEQKKSNVKNNFVAKLHKMAKKRHSSRSPKTISQIMSDLKKQDELDIQENEIISKINKEQEKYTVFRPILVTNTNKKDFLSIQFYPQVLVDIKTIYEKVSLILKHIVQIKQI